MSDNNPIKSNLEDQFKELTSIDGAPDEIKNEVFQTLDTLNLIGDIADLFTAKFSTTEAAFLDIMGNNSSESPSNDDIIESGEER